MKNVKLISINCYALFMKIQFCCNSDFVIVLTTVKWINH